MATWLPGAQVRKSSELVGLADIALYAAKAAGKDRAYATLMSDSVAEDRRRVDHVDAG